MRSQIRPAFALSALIALTSQPAALSFAQSGQLKAERTVNSDSQSSDNKSKKSSAKEDAGSLPLAPKNPAEKAQLSPRQKRQMAMSLIDGILASKAQIVPAEYSVLVQVEAATILWEVDRERSLSILRNAFDAMQRLTEEKSDDKASQVIPKKRQLLRASILRRIARLNPDLIKEITLKSSPDKPQRTILNRWTEEARAIMAVAYEKVDQDPALAARLAQQSLPFGLVDIPFFLFKLNSRDPRQAEQLAVSLIRLLRDSTVPPAELLQLRRFVLSRGRSAMLKNYFFESLAVRLRRDMRADATPDELRDTLETARQAFQSAATNLPDRQTEFAEIVFGLEALFNTRSLPLPGSRRLISVDSSSLNDVEPGDTKAIIDALPDIERMADSEARDKEYQHFALQAALKADVRLAENLLSRIENGELRKQATIRVYSPLVRKSLAESDWLQAQSYAFKVTDPIGRTLMLDGIAQSITRAGGDKARVNQIYSDAITQLNYDEPSENVAKAFLILARSLQRLDKGRSLEAVGSAIYVLNKLTRSGKLFEEEPDRAVGSWLSAPGLVNQEEVLDLNETIGTLFYEMAKSDVTAAHQTALGLLHYGLYSLADLGVARALLADAQQLKYREAEKGKSHQQGTIR